MGLEDDAKVIIENIERSIQNFEKNFLNGFMTDYRDLSTEVKKSYHFIISFIEDYEQWINSGKSDTFKDQITLFTNNLFEVPENVLRLLTHAHFNHPGDEISAIINNIPEFALYVISKGLKHFDDPEGNPSWLTHSTQIKQLSEKFQSRPEIEELIHIDPSAAATLKSDIKELKLIISIFNPTLDFFRSLCPEDLSINMDFFGEGGGTEVAGHPIRIPFDLINWITALTLVACDEVLDILSESTENQ